MWRCMQAAALCMPHLDASIEQGPEPVAQHAGLGTQQHAHKTGAEDPIAIEVPAECKQHPIEEEGVLQTNPEKQGSTGEST